MATTRKGWRSIVVDGASYRWMVKRDAKYWDNHTRKPMRFIVESFSGALLIVELKRPRLDYWLMPEHREEMRPVTPAEVAEQIRQALHVGWNPLIKTKPFFHPASS